ncbi:MAG: hypothetical protein IID41_07275 [Planctomycetes bacterium]|nr:hypothetical protein [Planctomycetota bacterium]
MDARQLPKRARIIVAEHLARCGLRWHCTRIFVRHDLRTERGPAWATMHTTSGSTFVLCLDADLEDGRGPSLESLIGHEIGHLVLNRCSLDHDTEELICDLVGRILAS